MHSYNSRVCGYLEAKPRENRKRGSYAQAPNPRTRYSLSNLYHPGMRGFERVATRGNKKCGLCLYLIHTFGPIACIKSDVRWYKYIYTAPTRICTPLIVSRSLRSLANYCTGKNVKCLTRKSMIYYLLHLQVKSSVHFHRAFLHEHRSPQPFLLLHSHLTRSVQA